MTNTQNVEELCRFRPPENGSLLIWEVTNHCNLECLHCCTNSSPYISTADDVDGQSAISVIREFPKVGVEVAYFTGGEPFVRDDFLEILEAVDTSVTEVYISSNGVLIDKVKAKRLSAINFQEITISMDGHTAALHNAVRGRPHAFNQTVNGIRACLEAGIPVRVSGIITPQNVQYVEDFVDFIVSLGVRSIVLHSVLPTGRAVQNPSLFLALDSRESILNKILYAEQKYSGKVKLDHSFVHDSSYAPMGCPGGDKVLHIAANGDVSPCSWLYKLNPRRFTLGNIKQSTLAACLEVSNQLMEPYLQRTKYCPIPYANT